MTSSILAPPSRGSVQIPNREFHRFTVAEYHKMLELGILSANDRVELLEGWVVDKMPQNPPYSNTVRRLNRRFASILPRDWTLGVQAPIMLSESEPEPDLSIARGSEEIYDGRQPGSADVALVIEVADSTLLEDRRYKGALYAEEGIPEYWLVNCVQSTIEVYTEPRGSQYTKSNVYRTKDFVPVVLNGNKIAEFAVSDVIAG